MIIFFHPVDGWISEQTVYSSSHSVCCEFSTAAGAHNTRSLRPAELNCGLIVMGSHPPSLLSRLFISRPWLRQGRKKQKSLRYFIFEVFVFFKVLYFLKFCIFLSFLFFKVLYFSKFCIF